MKVLWFSITPSLFSDELQSNNGRGWVASLENIVRKSPSIQLAIAFEYKDNRFKVERDGVIYYPINAFRTFIRRLKHKLIYKYEEETLIPYCLKVIADYKPDIIQVFGSEWCYGLVQNYTNIPVVIHMQGSIPPYFNARFPPGYNIYSQIIYNGLNLKKTFKDLLWERNFKQRALREEKILQRCKYFIGRTEWDKNITHLYAPGAKYFYCSEALRDIFINRINSWQFIKRKKITIVSIISSLLLKGFDVVLKTAKLLKETARIEFEWRIIGKTDYHTIEKIEKINSSKVNVNLLGILSAEKIIDELINCNLYVHPSYIDNSSNAICEAQYLGVPVISTNVGGASSLIYDNETGYLVPANDPFTLAATITELNNNETKLSTISKNARQIATDRHNPKMILNDLVSIYKNIEENFIHS